VSVRTTKKQFRVFEKECRRWLDKLSLSSWAVQIVHAEISDDSVFADCRTIDNNRAAALRMNTVVDIYRETLTDKFIRRYAIHEVLELLISGCGGIMRQVASSEIVERETHMVIRALENVLVEVKP